ncbi:MAG: hypothetical protein ABEL51_03725 [Salinibacter sp.]
MANEDPQTLIKKAKQGKNLTKAERRRVVRYTLFDSGQTLPTGALAQMLNVTARTIRNDRQAIEADLAEEAENQNLIGRLCAVTTSEIAAIERKLMESDLSTKDFIALHRERREALESYLDRIAAYRLEKEVQDTKELLERTNSNGHHSEAVTN